MIPSLDWSGGYRMHWRVLFRLFARPDSRPLRISLHVSVRILDNRLLRISYYMYPSEYPDNRLLTISYYMNPSEYPDNQLLRISYYMYPSEYPDNQLLRISYFMYPSEYPDLYFMFFTCEGIL